MELEVKYCKTKELDLEKLLRVIISICSHHKTPCEAKVTLKLDDYPNPVTMVLCECSLLPDMEMEEAEVLSMQCDYAVFAVEEEENIINTADASAFFLEGYLEAQRRLH